MTKRLSIDDGKRRIVKKSLVTVVIVHPNFNYYPAINDKCRQVM